MPEALESAIERATRPPRERLFRHRKMTDRAMALPLLGVFALLPPFATVFEIDTRLAGIPLIALYLFVVWGLLIAGAARLARPLRDQDDAGVRPEIHESAGDMG